MTRAGAALLLALLAACDGPSTAPEEAPADAVVPLARELSAAMPTVQGLPALAARAERRLRRGGPPVEPLDPAELSRFLPELGRAVLGEDTHLTRHDHRGYTYSIAHRRYRTRHGLVDLDLVDTGGGPELRGAFAARMALALARPDGDVILGDAGSAPSLEWLDAPSGRRHLEILLRDRLLVRVAGPRAVEGRDLAHVAAHLQLGALRRLVPRPEDV